MKAIDQVLSKLAELVTLGRYEALEGEKLILQRNVPRRTRLARGRFGRPVLVAPADAPPMTPERVKAILDKLP